MGFVLFVGMNPTDNGDVEDLLYGLSAQGNNAI
jgi:hypothetical protein